MEKIKMNVGRRPHRHCQNLSEDQWTVITLLSRIPKVYGGPLGPLNQIVRRGYCADDLYQAILRFQGNAVYSLSKPDGMVEPGGATMVYLNRLAALYGPVTDPMSKLTDEQVIGMYGDELQKVYRERMDQNAPEYLRKVQRDKEAAEKKWKTWKEKIMKDGKGSLNAKLAVDFLNDEQRKSNSSTTIAFYPWAVGFGEAFIGYDYQGGWQRSMMWRETVMEAYDKRKLLLNTHGMKGPAPIVLFANFTHYVMKLDEVAEFNRPVNP
jgi:hypothetical protein